MKKVVKSKETSLKLNGRPAQTTEARENQLINLAMDVAEQQMRDGTVSSQVLTHFLKAGSERAKLERQKLIHEDELLQAKRRYLDSAEDVKKVYEDALNAFKKYSGNDTCDP